jgi:hypothetical protein
VIDEWHLIPHTNIARQDISVRVLPDISAKQNGQQNGDNPPTPKASAWQAPGSASIPMILAQRYAQTVMQ